jgi:hypothetical protein
MQLLILLYIEGGSYIVEDETIWEFVVLCVSLVLAHIAVLTISSDTKSGREQVHRIYQPTISSATLLYIRSIASLKKFVCA